MSHTCRASRETKESSNGQGKTKNARQGVHHSATIKIAVNPLINSIHTTRDLNRSLP